MKGHLVLTGWHHPEYLAAAAAAFVAYGGEVDVRGVSMAELSGLLERLGGGYVSVDILGVGLVENLDRLAGTLVALNKQGVAVRWFSRQKMPDATRRALAAAKARFSELVVREADCLVDVVAMRFGLDDVCVSRFRAVGMAAEVSPEDYAKGVLPEEGVWQLLHRAAGFAHRDHGDESACGKVVESLASGRLIPAQGLSGELRGLMDDFLAGYSRELVTKAPQSQAAKARLLQAARCSRVSVLILGETGTGKQVAAEYIHANSDRRDRRFEHYNCAYGGSDDMLMDRLFGHEKGAFTGAAGQRNGLFDDANGGTLFLDEIGETSERVQAMLLTVLETGSFVRVGGDESRRVKVDVRLVCATNRDLQQMVLDGTFRLDLYQRICEFPVRLAPLRERKDDIGPIATNCWFNMTGRMPTKRQISALLDYDYPGNVRELISILKQAKALCDYGSGADYPKVDFGKLLEEHKNFNRKLIEGLRARRDGAVLDSGSYPDKQDEMLRRHAVCVFRRYGCNYAKAAAAAGISVNTLRKYIKPI